MNLRDLPAVGVVLARPAIEALTNELGRATVTRAVRDIIDRARKAGDVSVVTDEAIGAHAHRLARGTLLPVINATGVIVHTNLGRAPLAREAVDAIEHLSGYATLEYDLEKGTRGERHGHARELLIELTGAEDALVVNNNAAAMLLALASTSIGREVVVSRGELVEIGGGFRIPDVLAQSGARLVEIGSTNRTHLRDYERAITSSTTLLLKVHRSNFAIVGFTSEVDVRELAPLARKAGIPLAVDAGSGCIHASLASADEPTVRTLLEAGADLVMFSGDKLLGGPQAGIVVGKKKWVEPMRRHPLMRAIRPDKLCIAALVATLKLWRDSPERIPLVRYATTPVHELEARARVLAARIGGEAIATIARIGGGAAPMRELPSFGVRVKPASLLERLRESLVIARVEDDYVVLDLRCVPPEDDATIANALSG